MKRFAGKIVVVIGAGTGLGRAMAVGFAREGASLVIADVDAAALDVTLGLAKSHGAEALGVQTDVMRRESVDALATATLERFGRVDILCSNAGVVECLTPAWEKSPADWEWVMGVNLYGLVYAVNAFVPIMIKQGNGHFVSTASNTSLLSASGTATYVASKKANLGFCEALQYDLWHAGSPIKVSVICPNKIATELPNSARNRPASLPGRTPTAKEVAIQSAWLAEGSHTPDEAAAIALTGIAEERFYILTNPVDGEHAVEWAEGVRAGRLFSLKVRNRDYVP